MQIYNHALNPCKETLKQFKHCCEQDFVVEAALMPDAHSGYVAPIGAVLVTKDNLVPSWVGYDIGCGVTAAQLKEDVLTQVKKHAKEIYEEVNRTIPMGKGKLTPPNEVGEETQKELKKLIEKFMKGPYDEDVLAFLQKRAIRHIGSLGSGNHFIELGFEGKDAWIVVHSGSRGIGHRVAQGYMKKSANKEKGYEETHPLKLSSKLGKEYQNVLNFGLDFALLNRLEMIKKVVKAIEKVLDKKVKYEIWVNKNHNHAIPYGEYYIHRKGATPAKRNEKGVIPGNMRDGCFLVKGKGNKEFIQSSSHGAGRAYSRTQARQDFTLEQFKKSMKGITGTVENFTLDEAPMAYKNIFDVMEAQKDSVSIVKHVKPIINWKGK
tara:strand:- start:1105 stop:2238 length:1134 start_codon:yes stop_codon:yes gene_type:complete